MNYLLCVTDGKQWRCAGYTERFAGVSEWWAILLEQLFYFAERDGIDLTNAELFSMSWSCGERRT